MHAAPPVKGRVEGNDDPLWPNNAAVEDTHDGVLKGKKGGGGQWEGKGGLTA